MIVLTVNRYSNDNQPNTSNRPSYLTALTFTKTSSKEYLTFARPAQSEEQFVGLEKICLQ